MSGWSAVTPWSPRSIWESGERAGDAVWAWRASRVMWRRAEPSLQSLSYSYLRLYGLGSGEHMWLEQWGPSLSGSVTPFQVTFNRRGILKTASLCLLLCRLRKWVGREIRKKKEMSVLFIILRHKNKTFNIYWLLGVLFVILFSCFAI